MNKEKLIKSGLPIKEKSGKTEIAKELKITQELEDPYKNIDPNPPHDGIAAPKTKYKDLIGKPTLIVRTATSVDLSGSAETLICFHTERKAEIINAYFLYTEASSADTGITVEIGKESDRDYYYTGTTEVSKAIWYTKQVTLLKKDIVAGDTVTFYSAGSKVGTGEIMLIIEYKFIEQRTETIL